MYLKIWHNHHILTFKYVYIFYTVRKMKGLQCSAQHFSLLFAFLRKWRFIQRSGGSGTRLLGTYSHWSVGSICMLHMYFVSDYYYFHETFLKVMHVLPWNVKWVKFCTLGYHSTSYQWCKLLLTEFFFFYITVNEKTEHRPSLSKMHWSSKIWHYYLTNFVLIKIITLTSI